MCNRLGGLAIALLGIVAMASAAHAQTAYEPFDYTAGTGALANQNGGTGWSSSWGTGTNSVSSPGLTFSKNGQTLVTSGNTATTVGNNVGNFRQIATTVNSGTEWVSLLANLNSGTPGSGYAGVSLFNGGTEDLFIGQPSNKTVWGLDQSTGLQTTTTNIDSTTHLFVVEIDYGAGTGGNDRVRFYVDPTPGAAAPDVAPAIDVSTTRSASFNQLRIQSGSGGPAINFDELRLGTTYASVTPVPEPATLGISAIALGLLARRRVA